MSLSSFACNGVYKLRKMKDWEFQSMFVSIIV